MVAKRQKSKGAGEVFAVRLDDDLRRELQRTADQKGHPLSEEIRQRLRRSTTDDEKIHERFGDPRTYALFRLLHLAVRPVTEDGLEPVADWLDDRPEYLRTATAIRVLLRALEPAGEVDAQKEWEAEAQGIVTAGLLLQTLRDDWDGDSRPLLEALESRYRPDVIAGISQVLADRLRRSPGKILIDEMQRRYVEGTKP